MDAGSARDLTAIVRTLVDARDDLRALAVCGSGARGNPRPDSDLDLLIVARDVARWRDAHDWIGELPYGEARLAYRSHTAARYGAVWSAHIRLEPDAALELTFAAPDWANHDPVDPGTRQVVRDAFAIVVDKDKHLARLVEACAGG